MSSTSTALESWALPRLSSLLPLDTDSLKQIITYTAQLSPEQSVAHLQNLLGEDSPAVLEFISGFNSRRPRGDVSAPATAAASPSSGAQQTQNPQNEDKSRRKKEGRNGAKRGRGGSLRASDSPRRPEGYGDVSGGYVKGAQEEAYMTSAPRDRAGLVPPSSTGSSRTQSPAGGGNTPSRAPPSAQGPLISDYLPNVRSKRAGKQTTTGSSPSGSRPSTPAAANKSSSSATGTTTTTTNNIADLTAAIAALEVSTNTKDRKERKCSCNASLHPLFTPAPNCLSCGKIICALEGLQPCSFCGAQLLSSREVQDMIRELRSERGNEKMRAHNDGKRPGGGSSASVEDTGESVTGNVDTSSLQAAKAHRDKLLAFQGQNAQRTRIVDEAADFDVPTVASTQWMSPAQRALALKKQQRLLRELDERAKPEWEKKRMVMSLDVKTGKAVRTLEKPDAEETAGLGDEEEGEEGLHTSTDGHRLGGGDGGEAGGAFSRNPLLKGAGLVRPVWKAPTGQPVQERRRTQKQTWRRVQDDQEDNEQWVLDGGLRGYEEVERDGKPGTACG